MNLKVGVFYGGVSAEREVSIKTGKAVIKAVQELGFQCVPVDVDHKFLRNLAIPDIDVAFIALHGRFGEDGTIQALFELKGIPYTGSGVLASGLALNKKFTKLVFRELDIPTADYQILRYPENEIKLDLPVVVKPINEGSSIGMSIIREEIEIAEAVKRAYEFDTELLVEKFIEGREFTVAVLNNQPLPVIEILPKNEFYDYEAKYTYGLTDFVVPAQIDAELTRELQEIAIRAFRALGCEDFGRVDIIEKDGEFFVLEINTIPGMTETSLLPKAAAAANISFEQMIKEIVLNALETAKE